MASLIPVRYGDILYYYPRPSVKPPEVIKCLGSRYTLGDDEYVDQDGERFTTECILALWIREKFYELDEGLSESELWDYYKSLKRQLLLRS